MTVYPLTPPAIWIKQQACINSDFKLLFQIGWNGICYSKKYNRNGIRRFVITRTGMDKSTPKKVTVKDSKYGKGIFAASNFSKGDVILAITGQPLNFHQTLNFGENECYCLQVGKNSYIIPDPPFHFK